MSPLLAKAEEILDIASAGGNTPCDTAIVVDRQGGFRMMDPTGWSLPSLALEYGAAAVYRIERRGGGVRVEGWDGSDRCLLQRSHPAGRLRHLPGGTPVFQPGLLRLTA